MNLACIHTHTTFCDGKDDIETCCCIAAKKGLSSIGFSAHAPITKKTGIESTWNLSDEKLPIYIEAVKAAKKRWEGRLPVYLGLEVDYFPFLMGPMDKEYDQLGLDYIIASVHFIIPKNGKPFTVDDSTENVLSSIKESFGGDPRGMVEAYLDLEEAMIRAGGFDVLGHPDLIKVNNDGNRLFSEDEAFYQKKTAALASLLAGAGIPSELNTGGLNRGRTRTCYPSPFFLKQLCAQKVPIVINADAHKAEHLDGHYREAREAMIEAGYSESVVFSGRENGRPVWSKVRL